MAPGFGGFVGGDGDEPNPVRLFVPFLPGHGTENEGFRDADAGAGVNVSGDFVMIGVYQLHLFEQSLLAVSAGAAVFGVLVIDEGIIRCLTKFSASDDEFSESEVEGLEQAVPVVAAQKLIPRRLALGCCFFDYRSVGVAGE